MCQSDSYIHHKQCYQKTQFKDPLSFPHITLELPGERQTLEHRLAGVEVAGMDVALAILTTLLRPLADDPIRHQPEIPSPVELDMPPGHCVKWKTGNNPERLPRPSISINSTMRIHRCRYRLRHHRHRITRKQFLLYQRGIGLQMLPDNYIQREIPLCNPSRRLPHPAAKLRILDQNL